MASQVMNSAQRQTLAYWKRTQPALYAQAVAQFHAAGNPMAGMAGFGQSTGTDFNSILGNLTNLLTSYGQYKVATDVANSQTSANRSILSLPGTTAGGTSMTTWLILGGAVLVGLVAFLGFRKKRA